MTPASAELRRCLWCGEPLGSTEHAMHRTCVREKLNEPELDGRAPSSDELHPSPHDDSWVSGENARARNWRDA